MAAERLRRQLAGILPTPRSLLGKRIAPEERFSSNKSCTDEFKLEAVREVIERARPVADRSLPAAGLSPPSKRHSGLQGVPITGRRLFAWRG